MTPTSESQTTNPHDRLPGWLMVALLPVMLAVHGCGTLDRQVRTAAEARWAKELAAFDAADAANPPPPGGMLFVGSSSFRLWTNLAAAFPERRVINRGFGGSQMHELRALMDRLVWPYAARDIFVYEGDNDLANQREPAGIAREFREFAERVHRRQPASRIFFVAIKPSPARVALLPRAAEANRLIADYCASQSWLKFVDVATPMLDANGRPKPELFGPDQLHLNAAGYALWAQVIRAAM